METTIYPALVSGYAKTIYIDGTRTFPSIIPVYVDHVKEYAATGLVNGSNYYPAFKGYSLSQLENALSQGRISQDEFQDTIALIS
ncbi:hypothetical protein [Paenibacillus sp. UNC451MF]|uniref:hypothetical protein n=1 Tax=Paenibacillus sp. UNC451MF TaxID=1449063 RepID=UPI00048AAA78|nr:hypothetical protein [Paenibacillus sp. UNC451MF]